MSERKEWMLRYYSQEAKEKIAERAKHWTPEMQAESERQWKELIAEVEEAAKGGDPHSPEARQLAARWQELIRGFTQGDPEITAGLQRLYADRQNWPKEFQPPYSEAAAAFLRKAIAAAKQ